MLYSDFIKVMSAKRTSRYLKACKGDTRKAMTLYRYNLKLSQEMFSVISCCEVALRNAIDSVLSEQYGEDWMRDAILPGGLFDSPKNAGTTKIIKKVYEELTNKGNYSPSNMLSAMEFGVWKYMFSSTQFHATGRTLLRIFPQKPRTSKQQQYNNLYVFNELDAINRLRNRIAHHEPICFLHGGDSISTKYLLSCYDKIVNLFNWMGIPSRGLLFGLDHVYALSMRIESLAT